MPFSLCVSNHFVLISFVTFLHQGRKVDTLSQQQITDLQNMAAQCPLTGGVAVYQARTLLNALYNTFISYDDNCDVAANKKDNDPVVKSSVSNLQSVIVLFPNPNTGTMQLSYVLKEGENGAMELYDITGKLLNSYVLKANTNKLDINESQLQNGVYYYRVSINGENKVSDKIVIIK